VTALLEVEEVEAGYGDGLVLQGISLAVEQGQIVSVLGPNGAGKTTTLRAVCGMVPTRGRIALDGEDLCGRPPERIARTGIAHVPEGRGTFADLTTEENLQVGGYTRSRADVRADLDRCYDWFPRLKERKDQEAGSLSGGEQQMLAVARALMSRPRLLLLDEPSLGLAPILTRELFRRLGEVAHAEGLTVLIVEQNAHLVLELADYAYVLEAGRIALEGDAEKIKDDQGVQRSYLGY
jgi:branched-chain amino acid transport system ATP-binding protein